MKNEIEEIISGFDDPEDTFELMYLIGEGAYGSVYKALHKETGEIFAVKIVPTNGDITALKKEIQILKDCKHENIVKFYRSYFKNDQLWLVMEYCAAGSIIDIIRITKKSLGENEIATVLCMSLRGLEYLHDSKKIHRDIKAGNILLDDKGNAKLADFGVAAQLQYTLADQETVIGTPFWMSPEILSNSKYNKKTDIWSLGITAIELAEGEPPYSHIHPYRAMIAIKKNPPQGLTEPSNWSDEFNSFVRRCLTIDPKLRPNAKDLLRDPFILRKSKGKALIYEIVIENLPAIEAFRAKMDSKSNNESPMKSQTNNYFMNQAGTILNKENNGTMVVYDSEDEYNDPGTLVIKENVEVKEEPDFMKFYKAANSGNQNLNKTDDQNDIPPEFRNMDPKMIRMKIERLRKDMEMELKVISERYEDRISVCEKALHSIENRKISNSNEEIVYNRGGVKFYDKQQEKVEMNINMEYNRILAGKQPLTPPASSTAIGFDKIKKLVNTPSYELNPYNEARGKREILTKFQKPELEKNYSPLGKELQIEKPKPSFFENTKKPNIDKRQSPESPNFNNSKVNLPFEFAPYEKMKGPSKQANPQKEQFTKFAQQFSNPGNPNTSGSSLLSKGSQVQRNEATNLFERNLKTKPQAQPQAQPQPTVIQENNDENKKKIDSSKFKIPDFMKNAGKPNKEKQSPSFLFQPFGAGGTKLMK